MKTRTAYKIGHCLIVKDLECGRKDRWTTIAGYNHLQRPHIVGRELTLRHSMAIAAAWEPLDSYRTASTSP